MLEPAKRHHHNWTHKSPDKRVVYLLKHHPLLDTHVDLPELARWQFHNKIEGPDFAFDKEGFFGHLDIPRIRQGGASGFIWSVFTECPKDWNDTSAVGTMTQARSTLQQIDVAKRIVAKYPKDLSLATDVKSFRTQAKKGKISGFLGVEGLHQIGNSPAALRLYHELGVRYVTLTHMCHNKYADSASVPADFGGLSRDGRFIVQEMNRIGLMVDLSHVSDDTMRQALELSRAPVIFSHSGAQGVFKHERNAPDDVLDLLKKNDGVINIVFMQEYLGPDGRQVTIDTVVDHVLYVAERIGWRHVGIGSDFDGVEHLPQGLESVAQYPALIKRIIERSNATDAQLAGFVGGNTLRVLEQVERVAAKMQREGFVVYEVDEIVD
ncbi:dipeptidase [Protomyces lactucae-debilis]|uniref:Dipeptidase n=1 Tax=Protomyces lactucae-debilis TaxID=2754530 RepID=A0A1Y2FDN9_PROLT|nr:dipeptidase [Protomyces lactucae-debilis]ORY81534.1 dipeptidase [Protomyces lactucae-debilis]